MKKTFRILLQFVIVAAMTCLSQMARADVYECSTWEELRNTTDKVYNEPNSIIKLTADIDLEGKEVDGQLLDDDYYQTPFDGQGHVIKNGTIKGCLFAYTMGCTIKNLTFENIKATVRDEGGCADAQSILTLYARNMTFENIVFKGCKFQVNGDSKVKHASLLAAISNCSTVKNCSAEICEIQTKKENTLIGMFSGYALNTDFDKCQAVKCTINGNCENRIVTGGICAYAEECQITNCTTTGLINNTCTTGGIVGRMLNGDIDQCTNYMNCYSLSDHAGGIVGSFEGAEHTISNCVNHGLVYTETKSSMYGGIVGECRGNIQNCLNDGKIESYGNPIHGHIEGEEYGGIVGKQQYGTISGCVNNGEIGGYNKVGGIVGHMNSGTKLFFCLNTGTIHCDTEEYGMCVGSTDDGCQFENYYWQDDKESNITTYDYGKNAVSPKVMRSGWVAYNANPLATEKGYNIQWGQRMKNDGTYIDTCPYSGGPTVYKHDVGTNCKKDNTAVYYNNIEGPHCGEFSLNVEGKYVCSYCGQEVDLSDDSNAFSIYTAEDLKNFAENVVPGQPDANAVLMADIDCSEITLNPIGTKDIPYQGTFDGKNHRIKNLHIQTTSDCAGLFCRLGNYAIIENVIIDASCTIATTFLYGAAGIAGGVGSTLAESCFVKIINCGNEASVTGRTNVAGILGGVYNNDKSSIVIKNCYNTGTIKGEEESAAICGYARINYDVENCWNTGTVTGYESGMYFLRYGSGGTTTFKNNFSSTGSQSNVTSFSNDDLESGKLCYMLNGSTGGSTTGGWYQYLDQGISYNQPTWLVLPVSVYKYSGQRYCDDESETTFYSNYATIPATLHTYDNGICTRKAGETHYEPAELYNDQYLIHNAGNMYWVANRVNAGDTQYNCVLSNDITINNDLYVDGKLSTNLSGMRNWTPIGALTCSFKKTFDGQGHTISGLYSTVGGNEYAALGLIGVAGEKAVIKNVGVVDCYINNGSTSAQTFAGAILGYGGGSSIYNCYSTGQVHGTKYTGGIAGSIYTTSLNFSNNFVNVYSACTVDGSNAQYTGALFGTLMKGNNVYTGSLNSTIFYLASNTTGTAKYGTALTADEFKIGKAAQLLNKVSVDGFTLEYPWKQNIGTDEYPVMGNRGIYHKRQIGSAYHWGTIIAPFTLTSSDDIKYYTPCNMGTEDDATISLNKVETVEPNTPCFFYIVNVDEEASATDTHGITFTNSNDDWAMPENMQTTKAITLTGGNSIDLIGTYENVSPSISGSKKYYLANDKMWKGDKAFNVPALRAYLDGLNSSSAKALTLTISEGDNTTAIGEISADGKVTFYDGNSYNIAGQRVGKNAKGIIINNGKKTLVK